MAEILGLASSIITVVGVAGKLGTSTIRLKRLWDEVQDVPSSIRRCIEQLDLLAPAIEEMDTEFQKTRDMVQHDSAAKRSLEYSQKAVETLETLVRDMEKRINSEKKSKRLVAQLKIRMKKEVIEEHQQRLNSALQLVSLSQQTYLIALSRAQPRVIISELKAWQEAELQRQTNGPSNDNRIDQEQHNSVAVVAASSTDSAWLPTKRLMPRQNSGILGTFSYQSYEVDGTTTLSPKLGRTQVHQATVQLPWWMMQKTWDLQVFRSVGGWTMRLRNWTTRPNDSKIFSLVATGRTDSVLEAIRSNEASLYDRNSRGRTLLELAIGYNQLGLIKVFSEMGLCMADTDLVHVFASINFWSWQEKDTSQAIEFGQMWATEGGLAPDKSDWGIWGADLEDHILYLPTIWWVPEFRRHLYPTSESMRQLLPTIDWRFLNPELPLELLMEHSITPADVRDPPNNIVRNLWNLPWRYFHASLNQELDMELWRLLTRTIFVGATPKSISFCDELQFSNVAGIVRTLWQRQFLLRPFERWLNQTLAMWLEDLAGAGVDLEECIRWEVIGSRDYLDGEDLCTSLKLEIGMRLPESGPALVIQAFGRTPADWVFSWDPCVEELSNEFWTVIDSPEPQIPGAWMEEGQVKAVDEFGCPWCCMGMQLPCGTLGIQRDYKKCRNVPKPARIRDMTSCWFPGP